MFIPAAFVYTGHGWSEKIAKEHCHDLPMGGDKKEEFLDPLALSLSKGER